MKKIVYNNPETGGISIVIPNEDKKVAERALKRPLTDEEYEQHVIERSVPKGVKFRFVEDSDIPESREFRNAWVDKSKESCIDICCEKAQQIVLENLRRKREPLLLEQDKKMMIALREGTKLDKINEETQKLLDLTEPVKALPVKKKLNDKAILEQLREANKLLD